MNINRLFCLLLLPLLLLSITACDKGEEDKEPTKTDLLTARNWQGDRALVAGINIASQPQFADLFPDISTMTLQFRKDGTYTATFTHEDQQMTSTGNWEFRENETKLHFDLLTSFGLEETLGISTLSATELHLTTTVDIQGFPFPADIYFTGS